MNRWWGEEKPLSAYVTQMLRGASLVVWQKSSTNKMSSGNSQEFCAVLYRPGPGGREGGVFPVSSCSQLLPCPFGMITSIYLRPPGGSRGCPPHRRSPTENSHSPGPQSWCIDLRGVQTAGYAAVFCPSPFGDKRRITILVFL